MKSVIIILAITIMATPPALGFEIGARKPVPECNCYDFYSPVCGSDMTTYGNICFFSCAQKDNPTLTISTLGECSGVPETGDAGGIIA